MSSKNKYAGVYIVKDPNNNADDNCIAYFHFSGSPNKTVSDVYKNIPDETTLWFDGGPMAAPLGVNSSAKVSEVAIAYPKNPAYCMLRCTTSTSNVSNISGVSSANSASSHKIDTSYLNVDEHSPPRKRSNSASSCGSRRSVKFDDCPSPSNSTPGLPPRSPREDLTSKWVDRARSGFENAHHSSHPNDALSTALTCANKAIELDIHCADAFYVRGLIRRSPRSAKDQRDPQAAADDFTRALQIQQRSHYYSQLADCLFRDFYPPRTAEASEALQSALDRDQFDPVALELRQALQLPTSNNNNNNNTTPPKPCGHIHCGCTAVGGGDRCENHLSPSSQMSEYSVQLPAPPSSHKVAKAEIVSSSSSSAHPTPAVSEPSTNVCTLTRGNGQICGKPVVPANTQMGANKLCMDHLCPNCRWSGKSSRDQLCKSCTEMMSGICQVPTTDGKLCRKPAMQASSQAGENVLCIHHLCPSCKFVKKSSREPCCVNCQQKCKIQQNFPQYVNTNDHVNNNIYAAGYGHSGYSGGVPRHHRRSTSPPNLVYQQQPQPSAYGNLW